MEILSFFFFFLLIFPGNIYIDFLKQIIVLFYYIISADKILIKHNFSPTNDIKYDSKGILIPSKTFSTEFKEDILNYFKERKEDE
jgi:hypothetical protein